MKSIVYAFLIISAFLCLLADEFVVTQDIVLNPTNLTLTRMNQREKTDINGNLVGLVIIRTGIHDLLVVSPFLHKLEAKGGEYHAFFSPGTKLFTFKKEGFGNLKYELRERIGEIKSGTVYEMSITNRGISVISADANLLTLTLNLNEAGVYISKDNFAPVQAKDRLAVFRLPAGNYTFTFAKDGFQTSNQNIELSNDKTEEITLIPGTSAQKMPLTGFANLITEPEGAEILINSQRVGVTPFTVDELFPGEHELTLRKNLYHPQTMTFTITENGTFSPGTIILKPKFGYLSVNSSPQGATITLDNKPYGSTPSSKNQIESGNHRITIKSDLYYEYTEDFAISDGDEKFISVELQPAFGELTINSSPEPGADVYLGTDNAPVGKTPYHNSKMPSGRYHVRIAKDLWADSEEALEVKDGEKTERTLVLTRNFGTLEITADESSLIINGEPVGTGFVSKRLKPGKYSVRAERDRHRSDEKEVFLTLGETNKVSLSPIPMEGIVSIKCQAKDKPGPDVGADLFLNGNKLENISPASISLLIGDYSLVAKHSNFLDTEKKFKIAEGDRLKLELNMETYSGSMLAKADFWKTHKLIGLGSTLFIGGAAAYFHISSENAYTDHQSSTDTIKADSLYDDYKSGKSIRNVCIGLASTTTVYTLYSLIKQISYKKAFK
ncbi:MAG: PEGA domain-containing protein [Candidatus Cloacimonetes bacterium]|nr:PEGA domain-containing protein [Candidatus Cloacimonadota bacterium]